MSELKPCPFCGTDARLFGGLEAQENYSVWCLEGHHLEGGYDRDVMVKQWNQRSQVDVISSDYTPGLSPLAKRKIEQMGGEVMGVVVRNEAGALAAVTDLGRVTWLDDCVGGPVNHIADASNMVRGNVQAMGDLHFNEEDDYQSAVVIEFDSREDFKAAMQAGRCEFSVLGGDA